MSCSHVSEGEYCPNARCQEEAKALPRTLTDAVLFVSISTELLAPDPIAFSAACTFFWKKIHSVTPDLGGMTDAMRHAPKDDHET